MGKNIRNFDQFINESYNAESINEGKVFVVIVDDYDGKHNPEIARKYFSNQKKAEKWISDQGLEPAKHSKYITAPEGHIKSYSEPGGWGKTAELFQAVMETKLDEAFPGWDRNRVYGMFNDHNGKPTKLSKEILDICMKGLPKKLTDNISDVTGAGWKDQMITPPTTSNKGQSRGEVEYTTIVLNFIEPMGKGITHMTVGLRKRTSGPGTGYLAIELGAGGHTVDNGEHAIEFMDRPDEFLGKLYKEKFELLMK